MQYDIIDIIDYIENRFNEQPCEGSWKKLDGSTTSTDCGYAWDWWKNCMKPELMEKFNEI